jgi:hypothetical protein
VNQHLACSKVKKSLTDLLDTLQVMTSHNGDTLYFVLRNDGKKHSTKVLSPVLNTDVKKPIHSTIKKAEKFTVTQIYAYIHLPIYLCNVALKVFCIAL